MALPNPIGRQREVLYLPERGHVVVLGTAGSGKTTLAILRALYLAKGFTSSQGRVLLVTFNKALVTFLRSLLESEVDQRIDVRTYHKFALGYLSARKASGISLLANDNRLDVIRKAVSEASSQNSHPVYARPLELISTEFEWLAKTGIQTVGEYITAERVGRAGTRVARKDRTVIFDLYERYIRIRRLRGFDYDYDDVALGVLDGFANDKTSRLYQHIVIDEGQDFSPTMLRSLASGIPADGSLMFFGDVAQQIYGTRISWRSAGFSSPKIWRFEQNYRNSRQIADLALALSKMPFFEGEADLVAPRETKAEGPLPTLVRCKNKATEFNTTIQLASRMRQTQTVAILMRTRDMENPYLQKFSSSGIPVRRIHRKMPKWITSPGVFIGTYHAAKGLEFDSVILPYCSSDVIPNADRATALGDDEDSMSEEGRLLYVAITRAKTNLIILYSGRMTPLLPADSNLYQKAER